MQQETLFKKYVPFSLFNTLKPLNYSKLFSKKKKN